METKKTNMGRTSWNHWSHGRTNWVGDHSVVQRIKIVGSSEFVTDKFLNNFFIIIERMAEQIESVITQLCKESKLWVHLNL